LVEDRALRQRPEFGADAAQQLLQVAAGKVGAADRAAEEHVAAEDDRRIASHQEDNVPGRMTRDVEHLKPNSGRIDDVALPHQLIGRGAADVNAGEAAQVEHRIREHVRVAGADHERSVREGGLQRGVAGDMIDVTVRVQDDPNPQAFVGELSQNRIGLETGVDDDAVGRSGVPDEVRVLRERHRDDGVQLHEGLGLWRRHGEFARITKPVAAQGHCYNSAGTREPDHCVPKRQSCEDLRPDLGAGACWYESCYSVVLPARGGEVTEDKTHDAPATRTAPLGRSLPP
jgi:hypothetical protein